MSLRAWPRLPKTCGSFRSISIRPRRPSRSETCRRPLSRTDYGRIFFAALTLGLRDYAQKSGFSRCLVALSGGIDSAVVAVVAAAAFGPENVIAVSLPSSISSEHSKSDAEALAKALGIRFETIAIAELVSRMRQKPRSLRSLPGAPRM